ERRNSEIERIGHDGRALGDTRRGTAAEAQRDVARRFDGVAPGRSGDMRRRDDDWSIAKLVREREAEARAPHRQMNELSQRASTQTRRRRQIARLGELRWRLPRAEPLKITAGPRRVGTAERYSK